MNTVKLNSPISLEPTGNGFSASSPLSVKETVVCDLTKNVFTKV